ncbi:MAG TPA: DUF4097 family beta strand repeat-containing protein [Actinomadura sp.]|jgi:hypothetical protein|nr:DUF4097 family beta strand repeat-containing protein [Actinomadura sp.]
MPRWTVEDTTDLDFNGVVALKVMLVSGDVSVLAGGDEPSVHVAEVNGRPLTISHEAGMLNVSHENLLLEGLLTWVRNNRSSADVTVTVPPDCPVSLNLVNANAVVTGLTSGVSVRSGAGEITLDGVTGRVNADMIGGVVEAQGLDGTVQFTSVSGDLALAGGSIERLTGRSVSGRIAADIDLIEGGQVQVNTASGEVTLRLPASTSAEVSLTTITGRIDSSFPELKAPSRSVPHTLTGTLGDGSGRVTVNTVSGTITVLSRPDDNARPGGEPDVEV